METLPFEYGVLYRPVSKALYEYSSFLQVNQMTYIQAVNYDPNSAAYAGMPIVKDEFHFLPIAFIEKTQKVIGEVLVDEEITRNIMTPQGNNFGVTFNQSNTKETQTKSFRMELDVEEFIKNFEKVL